MAKKIKAVAFEVLESRGLPESTLPRIVLEVNFFDLTNEKTKLPVPYPKKEDEILVEEPDLLSKLNNGETFRSLIDRVDEYLKNPTRRCRPCSV